MRILLLNNWSYLRGGSDFIFLELGALLRAAGHDVLMMAPCGKREPDPRFEWRLFPGVETTSQSGLLQKFRTVTRMLFGEGAVRDLRRAITDWKPDIIHGHIIYHRIGPAFIPIAKRLGVPVVLTLHDYKITCPVYLHLRKGTVCEDCLSTSTAVIRSRCGGSRSKSILLWIEAELARKRRIYTAHVDAYMAPSQFIADMHVRGGVPREKIHVVRNFAQPAVESVMPRKGFLFAGRLSTEKGLPVLLEAASRSGHHLSIAGDGALRSQVEAAARKYSNVSYLGMLREAELLAELSSVVAMIAPSVCYENASISVHQAFATGTPVIASRIGGLPEQVVSGETGWLFEAGDSIGLAAAMDKALESPFEARRMGKEALLRSAGIYSFETHRREVERVYKEVLAGTP